MNGPSKRVVTVFSEWTLPTFCKVMVTGIWGATVKLGASACVMVVERSSGPSTVIKSMDPTRDLVVMDPEVVVLVAKIV